jgi:serine O-acetyltransferase
MKRGAIQGRSERERHKPQAILAMQHLGHALLRARIPVLPRLLEFLVRIVYAAAIPARARIGKNVHFGHNALAVIINAEAEIGARCFIGSHVVIGGDARRFGAPILEEEVVVHAGAMILGPIRIGRGAVIAAQALVLEDVPPFALVAGSPARIVRTEIEPADYAMI